MIETFNWKTQVQDGVEGTLTRTVTQTDFGDGYSQIVESGLNSEVGEWPLVFTGLRSEMMPILTFIRAHVSTSFVWRNPVGELGLYRVSYDSIKVKPLGAKLLTISVTFKQSYAP